MQTSVKYWKDGGSSKNETLIYVSPILKDHFIQFGQPKDKRINTITIEQLITHRSGFFGNSSLKKSDFYKSLKKLVRKYGVNGEHIDKLVSGALKQDLVSNPGTEYIYSNTNYLVLGLIIEEITNEKYENYCSRRVLSHANIYATLDPKGKILSSYAGWYLSPEEIIRVFSLYSPSKGFLTNELNNWNSESHKKELNEKSIWHYGLGTFISSHAGDNWYSHTGKWDRAPLDTPRSGSLAKSYSNILFFTDENVGVFAFIQPGNNDRSRKKLATWLLQSYEKGLQKAM